MKKRTSQLSRHIRRVWARSGDRAEKKVLPVPGYDGKDHFYLGPSGESKKT